MNYIPSHVKVVWGARGGWGHAAGHTYERQAIERWLGLHNTSPLTGELLHSNAVIRNHRLRSIVESYHATRLRAMDVSEE
jgi:hypothetical protein